MPKAKALQKGDEFSSPKKPNIFRRGNENFISPLFLVEVAPWKPFSSMNKRFYLGQDFMEEDWEYGLGSVYLGGPRNPKGKSWRLDIMKKFEETKSPVSFFIPETKNQLKGGFNKLPKDAIFQWQHMAISVASVILFWYPPGTITPQSSLEFGAWHKAERVFYGRASSTEYEYLDWLLYKEHKLYPAENLDQLVEMVTHWMRE